MRTGLGISEDLPVRVQQRLATEVEAAGLASLWTNEAAGRDALLLCQAWAAATTTLEVGIGVVPIWTRSPAQLAMAAATLQESSDGRFVLGLGVSHPATMGPWHDAQVRRPRQAAVDTLTILRSLLAGERVEHDGERSASRFRLDVVDLPAPPQLLLAAMGPKMLVQAGTDADGVLLNWSSAPEVARAGTIARAARAESPRAAEPFEVATYVRVAVDDDRDAARDALAREVGMYCALPAYAAHFARQGFADTVSAVKDAFRDGGRDAVPEAIDDGVLAQLGWWGTPDDDPRSALASYADAGLDHLVARVVVVGDDATASIRAAIATVAQR